MSNKSTAAGCGTGFPSLLMLAFIILKLCHVIDWSWWWVLSPAWIGAVIFGLFLLLIGVIAVCESD